MFLLRRRRPRAPLTPASPEEFEYEMIALREMEQDAMLWQTPTIVLTAQAFLLTIALTPTSTPSGRVIASMLGIVVAIMSMELMAKHRRLAAIDRQRMAVLEVKLHMSAIAERGWAPRRPANQKRPWWEVSSFRLWMIGLAGFIVADLGALVLTGVNLFAGLSV